MLSWQPAVPFPLTAEAFVLQVLPFLPPGRGALILILGGLLVLPVSLLMSRVGSRSGQAVAPLAFIPVAAPPAARPWAGTGIERAIRQAVGGTQLLSAAPGHYVVQLNRCDSCIRRVPGCGHERDAIERAVAPYLAAARVSERLCAQERRRAACTFDIWGR
jgi:hypothetical protein